MRSIARETIASANQAEFNREKILRSQEKSGRRLEMVNNDVALALRMAALHDGAAELHKASQRLPQTLRYNGIYKNR